MASTAATGLGGMRGWPPPPITAQIGSRTSASLPTGSPGPGAPRGATMTTWANEASPHWAARTVLDFDSLATRASRCASNPAGDGARLTTRDALPNPGSVSKARQPCAIAPDDDSLTTFAVLVKPPAASTATVPTSATGPPGCLVPAG